MANMHGTTTAYTYAHVHKYRREKILSHMANVNYRHFKTSQ